MIKLPVKENMNYSLQYELQNYPDIPHIIVVEYYNETAKHHKLLQLELSHQDKTIGYQLDSACIIDNNQEHFCCVLHINEKEYAFEGASHKRLEPFKWTSLLNRDENWTFKGTNVDVSVKDTYQWNFTKGYSMLFYYRN